MAEVLYRTTFLENWGTGAKRILDACKAHNVPEPTWSVDGGFVCVTFKRPAARTGSKSSSAQAGPQLGPQLDSSTTQVRPKYDPSTTQVKELIRSMSDEYMSMNEIMSSCKMRSLKRFRESYVAPALKEGAIERKYPESPKHPKQQYRLTEKAKAWKYYDAFKNMNDSSK